MSRFLRWAKGYRTLAFNTLIAFIAGLQASEVAALVPEKYVPYGIMGVTLINIWLRFKTDTAVGEKA